MKSTGATIAVTRRGDRFNSWFLHHRVVSVKTLSELLQNPVSSLMTWLVIGIALALPAILYIMLDNVSMVSGEWGGKPRVSLYLEQSVTAEAGLAMAGRVEREPGVEATRFVSSEQALLDFQRRSGFGEVLTTLERNPLPHVVEVIPASPDPKKLRDLIRFWESLSGVERVSVDMQWLERLFALLSFAERLVLALAVVLGLGVMLVMGNTIRLAIENRRAEIEVVKLVGGTDSFVRRPFLYLGFWYGLGGAVIAFLLVEVSLIALANPVEILAQSYRDDFTLQGPGLRGTLTLVVVGAGLGIVGATLAVSRHLSEVEPR